LKWINVLNNSSTGICVFTWGISKQNKIVNLFYLVLECSSEMTVKSTMSTLETL
jgi:hypothetical protein